MKGDSPLELMAQVPDYQRRIAEWELSGRAKRVLMCIVLWSFGEGRTSTWLLQDEIAEATEIGPADVGEVLARLQRAGVLQISGRRGAPRRFTFLPNAELVAPPLAIDPQRLARVTARVRERNLKASPGVDPDGQIVLLRTPLEQLADEQAAASRVVSSPGDARRVFERSLRELGWSDAEIEPTRSVALERLLSGAQSLGLSLAPALERVGETPSREREWVKDQVGEIPTRSREWVKHPVGEDISTRERASARAPVDSLIDSKSTIRESVSCALAEQEEQSVARLPCAAPRRFRDEDSNLLMEGLVELDTRGEFSDQRPSPNAPNLTRGELCWRTWVGRVERFRNEVFHARNSVREQLKAEGGKTIGKSNLGSIFKRAEEFARQAGRVLRILIF